jgi:phospholipase/carboxylesterase
LGAWSVNATDGYGVAPRLSARPGAPTLTSPNGRQSFTTPEVRGGIYVATGVDRLRPAPLLLFLHGANRTVDPFLDRHQPAAERAGVIVLAPFAAVGTWDAVRGAFGPDVAGLDSALRWVFERWTIDPGRVAVSGFSDGAT